MRGPSWWLLRGALALADRIAPVWPNSPRPPPATCWNRGLSVLIPDRDSPQLLSSCLPALYRALAGVNEDFEVIISCSGASADRYAALKRDYPKARWLHSRRPLGYARA
ncbi:MAG: hypothetical protein KDI71_20615, partial [Xanthomonadales bacterium]|nr:hypothetical protein [Xanthomonadales bacterium]